ncbi:MAG: hypothetical protein MJ197_00715 [Bacteroidales bacterium]|nr:hypothetical protein [Bacteroidales bacterium]
MKKQIVTLLTVVLFFAGLVGCAKMEESRLVGEWTVITVGDCGWPDVTTWTFHSNGDLVLVNDVNAKADSTVVASWDAFHDRWNNYIRIKSDYGWFQGNWRIDKHSRGTLLLTRESFLNGSKDGAFLRREFIKK